MSVDNSAPETGRVGQYRLLQRLGEGGMGVVHLALDANGKAVAVKVLRPHVASDPDARRRLAREVATLRRVRHPRVAAVIDADVECEVPYLVTDFVPGKPLDTHVRDHGPLPRGHIARVGSVLAEALRAIHALGIVHRDVKPANVMLLDGDPILIDFGIAQVADESRITRTGLVMGTPGYLSPEIIGGDPVTAATDWWGWGATLAYAATGRPPFGTGPVEVVLDRVRRGDCDVHGVDAGLRDTLTAALAVDPSRRPRPDRLVAGLAAVPPVRGGQRPVRPVAAEKTPPALFEERTEIVPPPAQADRTAVVSPPHPGDRTDVVAPPQRPDRSAVPAFRDEMTERVPPPSREARTEVVAPSPPVWGSPAPVRTGSVGHPGQQPQGSAQNALANGYAQGGPANGYAQGGPANGFANPNGRSRQAVAPQPAPAPPVAPGPQFARSAIPARQPDHGESAAAPADPGRGLLVGALVTFSAVAAVAPYGAVWLSALGMIALRVIDRSTTGLLLRRDQRGPRGSDPVMTALALPWRLVIAVPATVLALILPVLIGISVAFIVASAVAGAPAHAIPGSPGPLAAGMAALLLSAWWGPGGGSLRRGAATSVRFVCPNRTAQIVSWCVLGLVLASALIVIQGADSPDWGPLNGTRFLDLLSSR